MFYSYSRMHVTESGGRIFTHHQVFYVAVKIGIKIGLPYNKI